MYCVSCEVRTEFICYVEESRPPLWSSGQSPWLQNGDVLCFLWGTNWIDVCYVEESRPPLWSSGQSSWLQIQTSRVRFPALIDFLRSSGSGTASTQPCEYNCVATWSRKPKIRPWDPLCWPLYTLYTLKLALTLSTSGGRSVGIVCSRTKATDLLLVACVSTLRNYWK
jgi:hypothetical protein